MAIYHTSLECFTEANIYLKFYIISRLIYVVCKFLIHLAIRFQTVKKREKQHKDIDKFHLAIDGKYAKLNALIEKQALLLPVSESSEYDTNSITFLEVC